MVATKSRFIISSLFLLLLFLLLYLLNVCSMCKHNILPMCFTCLEGRVSRKRKQLRHFHDLLSRQIKRRIGQKAIPTGSFHGRSDCGLWTPPHFASVHPYQPHSIFVHNHCIGRTHWPVRCQTSDVSSTRAYTSLKIIIITNRSPYNDTYA